MSEETTRKRLSLSSGRGARRLGKVAWALTFPAIGLAFGAHVSVWLGLTDADQPWEVAVGLLGGWPAAIFSFGVLAGLVLAFFGFLIGIVSIERRSRPDDPGSGLRDAIVGVVLSGALLLLLLFGSLVEGPSAGSGASLVLLAAGFCALVAGLTGAWAGLRWVVGRLDNWLHRKGREPREHLLTTACFAAGFLAAGAGVCVVSAYLNRPAATEPLYSRGRSRNNLQVIGSAAHLYAARHGGRLPGSLRALVDESEDLEPRVLIAWGKAEERLEQASACDYGSLLDRAPSPVNLRWLRHDLLLAWEKLPSDGRRLVLFVNGDVGCVPTEEFGTLYREMTASIE